MATLHDGIPRLIYVKGSVESLMRRCSQMIDRYGQMTALNAQQIEQAVETMAEQGLRVLAFAKKAAASHQHSIDLDILAALKVRRFLNLTI
jgi:magnesium-transporting ATPase (P-type)